MIAKLINDIGANLPVDFDLHKKVPFLFNMMAYRHNYLGLEHQEYVKTISTNIPVIVTSLVMWWCHLQYKYSIVKEHNDAVVKKTKEGPMKEYEKDEQYMVTIPTDLYLSRLKKGGFPVDHEYQFEGETKMIISTMEHFTPMITLPLRIKLEAEPIDVVKFFAKEEYKLSNVYKLEDFITNVISNGLQYDDFYDQWDSVLATKDACWFAVHDFFFPTTDALWKKGIPPNAGTVMSKYFPEKFDEKTKKQLIKVLRLMADTNKNETSPKKQKKKKNSDNNMLENADQLIAERERPEWEKSGGKKKQKKSQKTTGDELQKSPVSTPQSKKTKEKSASKTPNQKSAAKAPREKSASKTPKEKSAAKTPKQKSAASSSKKRTEKANEEEDEEEADNPNPKSMKKTPAKRKTNEKSDDEEEVNAPAKRVKKGNQKAGTQKAPPAKKKNDETETDEEESEGKESEEEDHQPKHVVRQVQGKTHIKPITKRGKTLKTAPKNNLRGKETDEEETDEEDDVNNKGNNQNVDSDEFEGGNMNDGSDNEDDRDTLTKKLDKIPLSLSEDEHEDILDSNDVAMQFVLKSENSDKTLLETASEILLENTGKSKKKNNVNTWGKYWYAIDNLDFKGEFTGNHHLLVKSGIDAKKAECSVALDATISTQIIAKTWMAAANVVAEKIKIDNVNGVENDTPILEQIQAAYAELLQNEIWRHKLQLELRRAIAELPIFEWNSNPSPAFINDYQFTFDERDHFTLQRNHQSDESIVEELGDEDEEESDDDEEKGDEDEEEGDEDEEEGDEDEDEGEDDEDEGEDDEEGGDGENEGEDEDEGDEHEDVEQEERVPDEDENEGDDNDAQNMADSNDGEEDAEDEVAPTTQVDNVTAMMDTTSKLDTGNNNIVVTSPIPQTDVSDRTQGEDQNEEGLVQPTTQVEKEVGEDAKADVLPTTQTENITTMLGTTCNLDTGNNNTIGENSEFPKTDVSDRLPSEDENVEKIVGNELDSGVTEIACSTKESEKSDQVEVHDEEQNYLTADVGESILQQITEKELENENKEEEPVEFPIPDLSPKKRRGRGRPPGSKKTKNT